MIRMTRFIALIAGVLAFAAMGTRIGEVQAQEPGVAPTVATFRGSHNSFSTAEVVGPVPLHAGLVVLRARHGGTSNFSASLVTADPGKAPEDSYDNRYLMINEIGRYNGASATLLAEDGEYYILVGAGGTYEFQIEQPLSDNVTPVDQRRFEGNGQQVTPVFALPPGTYTLRGTSDGDLNFRAWLYQVDDLGGAAVSSNYDGRIIDITNGPADESATFTVPTERTPTGEIRNGLYLVAVYAGTLTPQGGQQGANWTIEIN